MADWSSEVGDEGVRRGLVAEFDLIEGCGGESVRSMTGESCMEIGVKARIFLPSVPRGGCGG
jgi:hypothetical protein